MPKVDEILKAVGLDDTTISKVIANDETIEVDAITTSVREAIKSAELDNPEFFKSLTMDKLKGTAVFNEVLQEGEKKGKGMTYKAFKEAFGIDDTNFSEDEKKQFFKTAKAKVTEQLGSLKMDDVAKALESENTSLKAKLAELEASGETLKTKLESEFNEKLTAKESKYAATTLLLPFQDNIKFGLNGSINEVIQRVANKFTVIAADGVVELKDKENPSFSAKIDGKPVTYLEALQHEIKAFGAWVEKSADDKKGAQVIKVDLNGGGAVASASGLSEAELKKLAEQHG